MGLSICEIQPFSPQADGAPLDLTVHMATGNVCTWQVQSLRKMSIRLPERPFLPAEISNCHLHYETGFFLQNPPESVSLCPWNSGFTAGAQVGSDAALSQQQLPNHSCPPLPPSVAKPEHQRSRGQTARSSVGSFNLGEQALAGQDPTPVDFSVLICRHMLTLPPCSSDPWGFLTGERRRSCHFRGSQG